jgi:gliding motility-associated-like protein
MPYLKNHTSFFCLLFLVVSLHISAQNLVKNPSFESIKSCPNNEDEFRWRINDWWGFDTSATNLFNTCGLPYGGGAPLTGIGYRTPHIGNGFAGLLMCAQAGYINYRDYAQGTFISALLKDSLYCVSYWVSRASGGIYWNPANQLFINSNAAGKNIDAYINDTLLNWNNGMGLNIVGFTPQIKNNTFIVDSINWTQISGIYKAHGGEMHITIGNFNDFSNTPLYTFRPGNLYRLDYFLDDVSVIPFTLSKPNLGRDTTLCLQNFPYTLTAPLGYDSVLWSNAAVNTQSINITQAGKYWVRCVANGCGSLTDTIVIKTPIIPKLLLRNDTTLCKGKQLTIKSNTVFTAYHWNTGATTPSITVTQAGTYILVAQHACGNQQDTVVIKYDSVPNLILNIGIDTNICHKDYVVPLVIKTTYTNLPNYNWSTGATTPDITVNTSSAYSMYVTYKCGTIHSNTIIVTACPPDTTLSIWIPNSFTPNGDGLNDAWRPVFINQDISELYIYDRWGQKLFNGNASNNYSWDGTFHNHICEQGVYAYIIIYQSASPAKRTGELQQTGVVNLIR